MRTTKKKTKQNKTKQKKKNIYIYIYILLGKSLQNKSTLNHARATQRGEREKKEGENLGSRGEGGEGVKILPRKFSQT